MKGLKEITRALAAALDPLTPKKNLASLDSRLIERAVREGVAGVLFKSLLSSGRLDTLDHVHRETLEAHYYQTLRRNLRLLRALGEVLFLANQRGVAVLVLQGMDLLNDPYEDVGLRPMTDIDLWVSRQDFEEIGRIFGSLGYERGAAYPSTFKQGPVLFDVHTHILWADRIRARRLLLRGGEKRLFERVREIEIEGHKALCLDPYDRVLYLSLHAFKHRAERLIWLVDIKRIFDRWNREDWEGFLRRAQNLNQRKTVTRILFLLDQIFRVRIPQNALEHMQGDRLGALERRILKGRLVNGALPHWGPVLLFSSQLGPGKRFRFFIEALFPRTPVLRQMFPSPTFLRPWQLYGKRTLQLVGMLVRAVKSAHD